MDKLKHLAGISELVSDIQVQLNRIEHKIDTALLNEDKIKSYVKKLIKDTNNTTNN